MRTRKIPNSQIAMGDSEKTVALKKAYAEIILNTANEAAARVMVSEKRVASLQHQLNCSKEESLRLLLRLKHMMDARTIEAETTSFNLKRKIDELEAQLHEAEDIVIDLRLEVNCLRDKLERATNTQVKPLSGRITSEDASSLKDPTPKPTAQSLLNSGYVTVTGSDMRNNVLNQGYPDNRCCIAAKQIERPNVSHVEYYYPHNSDLATVLTASKKPELYRNGCTQRICALERNLLDGKLTLGGLDGQHSLLRKEFRMETSAEDERQCTQSFLESKNLKAMDFSGEETKKSVKVRTTRRGRKTRFSRIKAGSLGFHPGQRMKPCQSSSFLSGYRTYTINGNVKPCEGSRTVSSIGAKALNKSIFVPIAAENDMKLGDEPVLVRQEGNSGEISTLPSSEMSSNMVNVSLAHSDLKETKASNVTNESSTKVDSVNDRLPKYTFQRKRKKEPLSNPDEKTSEESSLKRRAGENENSLQETAKSNLDPLSGSENFTVTAKALNNVPSAADNDMKLGDEPVLVRQEGNSGEISTIPSSEMSSNMVNVSFVHFDLKDTKASNLTNESSTKVDSVNDRLPKYSFQRKRQKEPLSKLDEKTSEESSLKRRARENEDSLQETAKSNLDPLSGSENFTVSAKALNKSKFVPSAADNDMKLGDEPVLVRQEGNSGETSTLPSSEISFNMVNVSFAHSDLKDTKASNVTNESSTKVDSVNDRLLKYTFQRKRKKEPLSKPDKKTSEESSLKRRAGEKENSLQETAKSNLDPLSGSKYFTVSVQALNRSRFVPGAADNDMKLGDESVLVRQEGDFVENSTPPSSEISSNMVNVSCAHSDLKDSKALNVTNESSIKVDSVNDRLLKCTFQRKGKKKPLSKPDEKTSEESSLKRRAGEKENGLQETAKSNLDPLSGSKYVTVSDKALDKSRFFPSAADNDMKLGDESVLVRQEGNSWVTSARPSSEISSNMVNVSFTHSDFLKDTKASNVTNESSTEVDCFNDRLLKSTFQRKHKKELLSKPDKKTSEESSLKRRAREKENSLREAAKTNLVNESSRHSRRPALVVARQVIPEECFSNERGVNGYFR